MPNSRLDMLFIVIFLFNDLANFLPYWDEILGLNARNFLEILGIKNFFPYLDENPKCEKEKGSFFQMISKQNQYLPPALTSCLNQNGYMTRELIRNERRDL